MKPPEQLPIDSSLKDAGRKIREIISYLRAIRIFPGSGIRVSQYPGGLMIACNPPKGNQNETSAYNGIFAVTYDAEKDKITASPGFCYVNGFYVLCEELSCSPGNGWICLTVTRSSGGQFIPGLKIVPGSGKLPDFPEGKADKELTVIYPLAGITQTGESYTVNQIHRYNPPILTIYGACK